MPSSVIVLACFMKGPKIEGSHQLYEINILMLSIYKIQYWTSCLSEIDHNLYAQMLQL